MWLAQNTRLVDLPFKTRTMSLLSPSLHPAQRVIGVTAKAWGIAPASAHAIARRAHHGYVPVRTLRRNAAASGSTGSLTMAHSW